MPELPEVTVVVNSLNKAIKGLVLDSVEYDWKPKFYWNGFSIKDLKGAKVKDVRRWGKVIIIDLEKTGPVDSFSIIIHLKLTGQLIYLDKQSLRSSTSSAGLKKIRVIGGGHPIPPLNTPVPNSTTRATFAFTNEGHLYFNDMRKFGWVKIVKSDEQSIKDAIGKVELGPDPMTMKVDEFISRIKKKPQARIKKLLMDQAFVAGVGNIYSDEALWRAKVHPKRSIVSLADAEIRAIFKGLIDSFSLAISKGGSSANSFVDGRGEKGLYLSFANAYHMTGTPCKRCKTPIVREKMDGRSAHYCPKCQLISPMGKQGKLI